MLGAEVRAPDAQCGSCLVLSSGVLVSIASTALGVAGIVLLALERFALGGLLLGLGVFAALLRLGAWTNRGFRAGQLTLRFCGGEVPRTRKELYYAIARMRGAVPTIVGGGWGFWTAHAAVRGPCIFMHALRGQVFDDDLEQHQVRFLAGATIRDVVKVLKSKPYRRTFWSTPSIQDITLGGWFGASCHGNSGAGGKPSSFAVEWLHVIDLTELGRGEPLQVRKWPYRHARRQFDDAAMKGESRYVLVSVTFDLGKMVSSTDVVQKELIRVRRGATLVADFDRWMDDDAPLRVLFVGSARKDYALALKYSWFDEAAVLARGGKLPMRKLCFGLFGKTVHRDPHDCSAACMSMQLDGCSMICNGWYEKDDEAYNGLLKMPHANAMTPPYEDALFGLGLVHLVGIRNFEFMFRLREPVGGNTSVAAQLAQLVDELIAFFQMHWGRAELRTGCTKLDRAVVFVDVGTRDAAAALVAPMLVKYAARCQLGLHTGKYRSPALCASVRKVAWLVTPATVYYGGGEEGC